VNDEDDALKIRMQYIIVNEDRQREIVIDLSEIPIRYSLMSETTTISETKSITTKKREEIRLLFFLFLNKNLPLFLLWRKHIIYYLEYLSPKNVKTH
jgi:hypothetical protein